MNQLLKKYRSVSYIWLSAYMLLLAYSAFHHHTYDIGYSHDICASRSADIPVTNNNDSLLGSVFTCQFNLVYSSAFSIDIADNSYSGTIDCADTADFDIDSNPLTTNYHLSNPLRAPPAASV